MFFGANDKRMTFKYNDKEKVSDKNSLLNKYKINDDLKNSSISEE